MGLITDIINQGLLDNIPAATETINISKENLSALRGGKSLVLVSNRESKVLVKIKSDSLSKVELSKADFEIRQLLNLR